MLSKDFEVFIDFQKCLDHLQKLNALVHWGTFDQVQANLEEADPTLIEGWLSNPRLLTDLLIDPRAAIKLITGYFDKLDEDCFSLTVVHVWQL